MDGQCFPEYAADQIMKDFMKEKNVTLTGKDVQYDMKNNLDKEFVVMGMGKLSNYYNYGFDSSIESRYFCVEVTPFNGSYSDRWYLYFTRADFGVLFNNLKQGEKGILAVCNIPRSVYEPGQGNMAEVQSARYSKN
jgi:hypothetical protein